MRAGGGEGAADGDPPGGRQGSVVRPQDRPRLSRCRRPVLPSGWRPRRQGLSGIQAKLKTHLRRVACPIVRESERILPIGDCSQADAFDLVGLPMIENALAGFNTSLVCYGQVLTAANPSSPYRVLCSSVPVADACMCAMLLEWHRKDIHHVGPSRRHG